MKLAALAAGGAALLAAAQAAEPPSNPLVGLFAARQPVFGLYAPSNRRPGQEPTQKTPAELAQEALGARSSDFLFDGSMEGGVDRGLPAFTEFVRALRQQPGAVRRAVPLMVKTPKLAPDYARARADVGRQLDLGVDGIVFVEVESAEELRQGLAAMRAKAGLWPLDPEGALLAWAIVESKAGLARVREIAAVKGVAALFPGAGTLRRVFTTTNAAGERSFDAAGWEAAIQQVLAACKEFSVPCGYPASADDVELRAKQGFSVFISAWGDGGFQAIERGRRALAPPVEIQTASGTPLEEKGRAQLERILKAHDLGRWTFTRSVRIQSRVIPHSHPVLTLNTQYVDDDAAQTATFLHEQFHWYVSERAAASAAAKAELRTLYPEVPAETPRGANGEDSTYLHLIVCTLELQAAAKLFGEDAARTLLGGWKHYTWVYETVLRDRERLGALIARHGLGLP